VLFR